jgi:transcriptional antiterminator Rof (Rho-off)
MSICATSNARALHFTNELRLMELDRNYWAERYTKQETGWDIGGPSTPLREYIDQLKDTDLRILIPGGGRAYEAEHAHRKGFRNVFVIDLTDAPLDDLLQRCPDFPREHFIVGDFFTHVGQYDRILEQTFFCALDPALRERYVAHMHTLLKPGGKLVGVLFNIPLNADRPPFGGSGEDYAPLFRKHFHEVSLEPCRNSIKPRAGNELWLCAVKEKAYAPIDCNLYDRYEAAATLKRTVVLTTDTGEEVQGVITDLFIRERIEWLRLSDGAEIRLDRILRME